MGWSAASSAHHRLGDFVVTVGQTGHVVALDWNDVSAGIGVGASAASVLAALWVVRRGVLAWWRRSIGLRRAQARTLDGLCCGSSITYIEGLLGTPQFARISDGESDRVYRLPGGWVAVHEKAGALRSFAITITDSKLYYSTSTLTVDNIDVDLGRDTFDAVEARTMGQYGWISARRWGYVEEYYFGNPGWYQTYWLSHNDAGCGHMGPLDGGMELRTGHFDPKGGGLDKELSAPLGITINTLIVLAPHADASEQRGSARMGVDADQVRLARR